MTTRKKRIPLFECQECRRKFYSVKAAEQASFGSEGCPGCGGADIDQYVAPEYLEAVDACVQRQKEVEGR